MAELEITQTLMCAKAAKLAYSERTDLAQMASELGFDDCDTKLIEKSNHAAVVINHDDYTIYSFRGTELSDLRDWLANIDVRPIESDLGHVHNGFWNAMLLFEDELSEFESKIEGRHAFLTGHSLGGAMACLARVGFDSELTGVFTFAQPPVGNRQFGIKYIKRFGHTYFRIINELDDVPTLPVPFLNPLNAFRPMGTAFRLFRNGELRTETSFLRSGQEAWASARNPGERAKQIIHSMDEHIRRLTLAHHAT